jgi:hypothetical protein
MDAYAIYGDYICSDECIVCSYMSDCRWQCSCGVIFAHLFGSRRDLELGRGKVRIKEQLEYHKYKETMWYHQMTIVFRDPTKEKARVLVPALRGVNPLLTNNKIVGKWRSLMLNLLDDISMKKIEDFVLGLGKGSRLGELIRLLGPRTKRLAGF